MNRKPHDDARLPQPAAWACPSSAISRQIPPGKDQAKSSVCSVPTLSSLCHFSTEFPRHSTHSTKFHIEKSRAKNPAAQDPPPHRRYATAGPLSFVIPPQRPS